MDKNESAILITILCLDELGRIEHIIVKKKKN